ncbi:MAG: hypothetical protein GXO88_14135 [Chlorobi bacterium]|nr:hypothetical protein [Chlorobiota bacterium]
MSFDIGLSNKPNDFFVKMIIDGFLSMRFPDGQDRNGSKVAYESPEKL